MPTRLTPTIATHAARADAPARARATTLAATLAALLAAAPLAAQDAPRSAAAAEPPELAAPAAPAAPASADVATLAWMQGCWERSTRSGAAEEQWTAPRGGTMLGLGRTIRGEATVAWEYLGIHGREGALVYTAMPSGQAPAEFTATVVADTLVVFENQAHDFPQRILYRPAAGDSLHARIEGPSGGQTRGIDFRFGRAACPGG